MNFCFVPFRKTTQRRTYQSNLIFFFSRNTASYLIIFVNYCLSPIAGRIASNSPRQPTYYLCIEGDRSHLCQEICRGATERLCFLSGRFESRRDLAAVQPPVFWVPPARARPTHAASFVARISLLPDEKRKKKKKKEKNNNKNKKKQH